MFTYLQIAASKTQSLKSSMPWFARNEDLMYSYGMIDILLSVFVLLG